MRVQSGEPGRHDVRNREAFFFGFGFWGGGEGERVLVQRASNHAVHTYTSI